MKTYYVSVNYVRVGRKVIIREKGGTFFVKVGAADQGEAIEAAEDYTLEELDENEAIMADETEVEEKPCHGIDYIDIGGGPATNLVEIPEDDFNSQYPLLKNHLDAHASWDGCLFETYGAELAFVKKQDARAVWTLATDDDGQEYLTSGFHFVNRLGYLVSTALWPEGSDIQVDLSMHDEQR